MDDPGISPTARRQFLHRACVGLAGAGVGGQAMWANAQRAHKPPEPHKLTVAMGGKQALGHLPLLLAQSLGYFEAEGLQVELLDVVNDEATLQAVHRGDAQLAACAYPLNIAQHARGAPWRSLVLQTRTPLVVLGVSSRDLPGFKGVADLRGKKVGLLQPGVADMVLDAVLARAKVWPSQFTKVRGDDAFDLVQRFRAGELDALCASDARVWALEQQGELRVVADTRTQRGTSSVFGGVLPGTAVCVPEAWAVAHPHLAQKMADGLVHALKWLQTAGPADLIRAVPEANFGSGRAHFLSAIDKARDGFSPDGLLTPEGTQTALKALERVDPQVRIAWIDLRKTYTNEFAQRAKNRFRV